MANIVGRNSLWTPEGEVNFGGKGQEFMTPAEMRVMHNLHAVAQKFNFGLVCMRCDKALQGVNQGGESVFVITCQCREIRGSSRQG